MSGRKIKWLIALSIVGICLVAISFLNLGDNIVYFYTPAEAQEKAVQLASKTVKVGGLVKPGTVNWQRENLSLGFLLTDLKGHDIQIRYQGSPPDLFKEGQGVVVEGRLLADGQNMKAHNLMVKHSEEYKKPDDHSRMDQALLEKSLFKNENIKKKEP